MDVFRLTSAQIGEQLEENGLDETMDTNNRSRERNQVRDFGNELSDVQKKRTK